MPSTSEKQAVAMRIAKAGKSNIGIPQSVGADFVAADKKAGKYAEGGVVKVHVPDGAKPKSVKVKMKFADGGTVTPPSPPPPKPTIIDRIKAIIGGSTAAATQTRQDKEKALGLKGGGAVRRGMGMATRGGGKGKVC